MSKKVRRAISLRGLDKVYELSKVVEIHLEEGTHKFIYLEEMKDGTWRLCYTSETIPDIQKLEGLDLIREN